MHKYILFEITYYILISLTLEKVKGTRLKKDIIYNVKKKIVFITNRFLLYILVCSVLHLTVKHNQVANEKYKINKWIRISFNIPTLAVMILLKVLCRCN